MYQNIQNVSLQKKKKPKTVNHIIIIRQTPGYHLSEYNK